MIYNIKPNFKKAKEAANLMLLSSNIVESFPYEISRLVNEKSDIRCVSYDTAKKRCSNLNCEDLGSDDAILVEYHNKRIILINKEKYNKRVRFSVGHELGHHILGHNLLESDKNILDTYEIEANQFAAQLLMPEEIINEFIRRGKSISEQSIMKWFLVSKEAAKKRLELFRKYDYGKRTLEEKDIYDQLIFKFNNYINSIAPLTYYLEDEDEIQIIRNSWFSDR